MHKRQRDFFIISLTPHGFPDDIRLPARGNGRKHPAASRVTEVARNLGRRLLWLLEGTRTGYGKAGGGGLRKMTCP